jgi:hypothetical protein
MVNLECIISLYNIRQVNVQVTYKKRITKNLGNYESIAVEMGIEDDVNYDAGETFEEAYVRIRELVNFKLKKELSKVGGK